METTLVRGFVLLLALAGFGASSVSSHPVHTGGGVHSNTTGLPVCPPSDPNHCGMDDGSGN